MRSSLLFLLSLGLAVTLAACGSDDDQTSTTESTTSQSSVEAQSGKTHEVEPEPVPALTLETMEGNTIEIAEQDGQVLLINFWATWCAPCRKEIPDLKALHSDLEGLTVIGVALDRDGAEVVTPFVEEQAINYPIVLDADRSVESELGPTYGIPTTLVVDPNGQITHRVVGIFPVEELKPELESMLSADEPTA